MFQVPQNTVERTARSIETFLRALGECAAIDCSMCVGGPDPINASYFDVSFVTHTGINASVKVMSPIDIVFMHNPASPQANVRCATETAARVALINFFADL